jgi:protein KRI1
MKDMERLDGIDAEAEDKADEHEENYNFRFEQKTGAYLTTFAREAPEESMRRKDDKRKDERERKRERKDEEKRKRKEELEALKQMKREEIREKLKQT